MASFCSRQGNFYRLAIAHLAHENYLGCLAERGAETVGEGVEVATKFALVDGGLLVGMDKLYGVFQSNNVHGLRLVHSIDKSGQRRRLPASSGPGDQD